MSRTKLTTVRTGQRVYWVDPDRGLGSGTGTVVSQHDEPVEDEEVIALQMDSGSEAEVLLHELRSARDMGVWWIVTLREEGDDEDSLLIVRGEDEEQAVQHAKVAFYNDNDLCGTPTIYVNHIVRCVCTEAPEHIRAAPC